MLLHILYRLLSAVLRLLQNYSSFQQVVLVACQAVPLCKDSLPEELPAVVRELQQESFKVFSQLDIRNNSVLLESVLQFTVELWISYPTQLPALCNIAQLADLVNTVFEQDDWKFTFQVGQDFVGHLMKVLSDEQLQELEKEGVCRKLTGLLSHYNNISPEHLQLILLGVQCLPN